MAARPGDVVRGIVHRISTAKQLVNGDQVLIIYYIVILLFFLVDTLLRKHYYSLKTKSPGKLTEELSRFYELYMKHGFIIVNLILLVTCIILTVHDEGFDADYLLTIILCFVIYTVLMKLFLKLFVNEDSYQSGMLQRYLNVVCYMILGSYFSFFMPFVRKPTLLTTFVGLFIGLIACFYIMIQAIFNPAILRQGRDDNKVLKEAWGILKGTLSIVVCILLLEYMMVYSCFVTDGGLYQTGEGRVLNPFDMFYYLIISFTTIGYGDIYPVRVGALYYSEFTAIVIGLSSMFTSACFVAAVISGTSSLAQSVLAKKGGSKDSDSGDGTKASDTGGDAKGKEDSPSDSGGPDSG